MDQLIEINTLDEYKEAIKNKSSFYLRHRGVLIVCLLSHLLETVDKKISSFTFYSINRVILLSYAKI